MIQGMKVTSDGGYLITDNANGTVYVIRLDP